MTRDDLIAVLAVTFSAVGMGLFALAMVEYFEGYEYKRSQAKAYECMNEKGGDPTYRFGKFKDCIGGKQ